jgi:hypothetical protein
MTLTQRGSNYFSPGNPRRPLLVIGMVCLWTPIRASLIAPLVAYSQFGIVPQRRKRRSGKHRALAGNLRPRGKWPGTALREWPVFPLDVKHPSWWFRLVGLILICWAVTLLKGGRPESSPMRDPPALPGRQ